VLHAETPHRGEPAGRLRDHAGRGLHQRLHDDGRDRLAVLAQRLGQRFEARAPAVRLVQAVGAERAVGRRDLEAVEEERPVGVVKEPDAAHRDRPERVTVIGVREVDEAGAPRLAPELPVLERDLEGDLDGRAAGVGVEDAGEAGRGDPREALGQHDGGHVAQAQEGAVGDPVELRPDGAIDGALAVAVDVHPEGGNAVEVAVPFDVDQIRPLPALDDERLLAEPLLHLGKGVPEMAAVLLRQVLLPDPAGLFGERVHQTIPIRRPTRSKASSARSS
jgi:hypothetical protein